MRSDIIHIGRIYESIHEMEESGKYVIGWKRGIYPTLATAETALERGDLYVAEHNGKICASAIINDIQLPEYSGGNWIYPANDFEVLVLHTLVVDPFSSHKGCGTEFVNFYEQMARALGLKALRIDTQAKNINAREFYPNFGFREAGIVKCDFFGGHGTVDLVLLEKSLI